jgi:uncharacterized iron-regulated membrane protein
MRVFAGLTGFLVPPLGLLGAVVWLSDRPMVAPPCPEGVFRDGQWIGPMCVGGFLSTTFAFVLVVLGLVGALVAVRVVDAGRS